MERIITVIKTYVMEQHAIQLPQGMAEENKLTKNMYSNYFVMEVRNDYMPQANITTNTGA